MGCLFLCLVFTTAAQSSTLERIIKFAGITWGATDHNTVWTDTQGLHLRIQNEDGDWQVADIFSTLDVGYGAYRFFVTKTNPFIDNLDPSVVAGFFLYPVNCGKGCQKEVDIEITRWSRPGDPLNAQFVVQPYRTNGNRHQFNLALNQAQSVHTIVWTPTRIDFSVAAGNNPDAILHSWSYTGPYIPRESDHIRLDLDFWLDDGRDPTNGQEDEILITDIEIPGVCRPVTQALTCGGTLSGSTLAAGSRNQVLRYDNGDWDEWIEGGREMTYTFKPDQAGPVSLRVEGFGKDLDVFLVEKNSENDCSSNETVAGGNEILSYEAEKKTYFVVVDGFIGATGDFALSADCSGAVPPADPPHEYEQLFLPLVGR